MGINSSMSLWLALPISALMGVMSGLSPCTLPTALLVASYVSSRATLGRRQGFTLSLAFVLGTAITWSLLGSFMGFMGSRLAHAWWFNFVVSAVLVFTGLWILGIIKLEPESRFTSRPRRGSGVLGALILGMLLAVSASPCTLPVALSVMAYASTQGSPVYGTVLMGVFALGRGIPLILVGTFSAWLQDMQRLAKFQRLIEMGAGLLMLGLGTYYLFK